MFHSDFDPTKHARRSENLTSDAIKKKLAIGGTAVALVMTGATAILGGHDKEANAPVSGLGNTAELSRANEAHKAGNVIQNEVTRQHDADQALRESLPEQPAIVPPAETTVPEQDAPVHVQ